ncbi:MAG: dienelactone hydrolase family protein [Aquabacterium sp.]|nr:MAG: dienelactone hydrolase family protein [Aquabacterium sp.]
MSSQPTFAPAAQPVPDHVITTGTQGLVAGEIRLPARDVDLPAYRAAPAGPGPHPVVLVVQEIFGVHEHIRDVTRRLARLGYLAIAPELYFRQGDPSQAASVDELRERIVSKVPDDQVLADLDAALDWAARNGGDATKLAVTGFCWGGRITWLYAAHQPKVKAGVAWYGRLLGPTNELQPRHPIDVAGRLHAPVLGLYGGQDQGIPLEQVQRFTAALKESGSASTVHVYPDAPHAFYADYRPSYRPAEAKDGWARLQDWLKQQDVTPAA